ncbi:MAG TPA: AraC family transcriptional regulator [Acidobacteriota bacterium]|nr:AraC family transcriptional regulator [Acidobacteriota bacterium]
MLLNRLYPLKMLDTRLSIVPYLNNLEIAETTYINHEFPRHLHETYVIEVVVRGNVCFECDRKTYIAPEGSIILLHPGQVHNGRSADSSAVMYRSFHPTADWMMWSSHYLNCSSYPAHFKSIIIEDRSIAQQLVKAHKAFQKQDVLNSESLMLEAFSSVLESKSDVSKNAPESIARAKEYLHAEYTRSVQLTELADISGLSPFYFLRTFAKTTGLTPHEYLCNLRVEKARQFLSDGLSIAETATATGFFDQSHLHRHFRRILGITPGKYRAILSKKKFNSTS